MDNEYKQWLIDLKQKISQSQIKAAVKVNTELLRLYWDLGHDIVARYEALFYVQKTIKNGWSRAVLMNFIEADLYSAQGKSISIMSTSKCRSTNSKSRSDDTFSVRMVRQLCRDGACPVSTFRRLKPPANQMSSPRNCFAMKPIRHDVGDATFRNETGNFFSYFKR